MSRRTLTRPAALLLAVACATGLSSGLITTTATTASAATTCGALFDDFAYTSPGDSAFTGHGWQARSGAGAPGVPGAAWSPGNITFPTVDGQKVARLSAFTDGTSAGTSQTEFFTRDRTFRNGTYASRIRFTDAPVSGADGDHVNETFFAIGPAQRYDYDPDYSELDFTEYLPNGGWGATGPIAYQTSYNGYRLEPWDPHNTHSSQTASLNGWHTVVTQVGGGHVKYYLDGRLVGDHTVDEQTGRYPVTPRADMTVNFNLWFIDTAGHTGGRSTYTEDVDWFYFAKDQTVAPTEVDATAASLRSAGTAHLDTRASGDCGGTGGGTGGSGSTLVSNWNNKCLDVPGFTFTPGVQLTVWDCTGAENQAWQFVDGTVRTKNNLCLDAAGAATANATIVQTSTCNGNTAQQFAFGANGSLINQRSGRCLDIAAWNGANGAGLHLWDCVGGANQSWRRV